jgi:hypothetical protein
MKFKSIFFTSLLFWGLANQISAQTPVQEYAHDPARSFRLNPISSGVKGTPLLFEQAQLGNILLSNGKTYQGIPFNIKLDKGELFIQTAGVDSDPFMVKNWERVETADINTRVFTKEQVGTKTEIVETLWKGNGLRIIAVHRKTFVQPYVQRDGYSGPQYDEFRYDISYFQVEGMKFTEIKTTKAGLKAFAGTKEKAVDDLIKREKLKLDQPGDFMKIISLVMQEI